MGKLKITSITRFLSIILGIIYIASGLSKAMNIDGFVNLLLNYGSSWFGYFAPLITGFEVFLGFGLILGAYQKQLARVSFGFLIILTILFGWAYFFRGIHDCGCFGDILKLSPIVTVSKNIVMLTISWVIWNKSTKDNKMIFLLISLLFGIIITSINGFEVKSRLNSDMNLYSLDLKKSFLNSYLKGGNQVILIFNPLCKPCRSESLKLNGVENVTAIYADIFNENHIREYKSIVKPTFPAYKADKDSINKHFFVYPTILYFRNNALQKVSHETLL